MADSEEELIREGLEGRYLDALVAIRAFDEALHARLDRIVERWKTKSFSLGEQREMGLATTKSGRVVYVWRAGGGKDKPAGLEVGVWWEHPRLGAGPHFYANFTTTEGKPVPLSYPGTLPHIRRVEYGIGPRLFLTPGPGSMDLDGELATLLRELDRTR
jgi:hypothetical protein